MLTLKEVKKMPVIRQDHSRNIVAEDTLRRVSISRMTIADGAPYNNQVTIEIMLNNEWRVVVQYEAK